MTGSVQHCFLVLLQISDTSIKKTIHIICVDEVKTSWLVSTS